MAETAIIAVIGTASVVAVLGISGAIVLRLLARRPAEISGGEPTE